MNRQIGRHLIADINLTNGSSLIDRPLMTAVLLNGLESEGFEIIATTGHDFSGGGFTTIVLLGESHASIHTYPEERYMAFDLFSCGDKNPESVLEFILKELGPSQVKKTTITRQTTG